MVIPDTDLWLSVSGSGVALLKKTEKWIDVLFFLKEKHEGQRDPSLYPSSSELVIDTAAYFLLPALGP